MIVRLIAALSAVVIVLIVVLAVFFGDSTPALRPLPSAAGQPALLFDARRSESAHYQIHSTASPEQTALVTNAVEHLYTAYAATFPGTLPQHRLILVLYRDRDQFKRNNRSGPWAEGYYLKPRSHAYYDAAARNPYHWMLHEVTHQLTREVSGFKTNRWIDEGLATYFSTSRIDASGLHLGDIDPNTYPIWWLKPDTFSGDKAQDLENGDFISLRQLLTGQDAPDVDTHFNQYYLCAWSLTHFLFHYDGGKYAQAHRQLIARGGGVNDFVALIGPLDRIEAEWYPYLLQQARTLSAPP